MAIWLSIMHTLSIGMIAALVLTGTAMGEISRNGLVAEWHFEDDAKDSSGNGIDGTINGATFVDGKFGKTLNFDGINDYVDFGTGKNKLDFGRGDFSIEFWMNYKGTTVHPNTTTIMEKRSEEAGNPGFMAWTTTWGGDGSNYGLFVATSTASWGNGNAEDWGKYSPNKWYHVVFVRTEDTWAIYKDGAYSASSTKDSIGLNVNNDASFKIGVTGTSSPYFKGLIDEVRIYNRALSANEVKANYEAGQIIITSIPPGAEVQVDGTSIGIASTSLVYTVTPGIHTVKCKLAGYSDEERTVTVTPSSATTVTCSLKTPTSSSPKLSVSPTSLNFGTMNAGESDSEQLSISNVGGGTLKWNISADDKPWININPTSGTNSGIVTIEINTEGLSQSNYSGNIDIKSNGGNEKRSISFNIDEIAMPSPPKNGSDPNGSGTEVPPKTDPISDSVIIALITTFGTIITAYFGYRAIKKKE